MYTYICICIFINTYIYICMQQIHIFIYVCKPNMFPLTHCLRGNANIKYTYIHTYISIYLYIHVFTYVCRPNMFLLTHCLRGNTHTIYIYKHNIYLHVTHTRHTIVVDTSSEKREVDSLHHEK